jgi:hypothetical protein
MFQTSCGQRRKLPIVIWVFDAPGIDLPPAASKLLRDFPNAGIRV